MRCRRIVLALLLAVVVGVVVSPEETARQATAAPYRPIRVLWTRPSGIIALAPGESTVVSLGVTPSLDVERRVLIIPRARRPFLSVQPSQGYLEGLTQGEEMPFDLQITAGTIITRRMRATVVLRLSEGGRRAIGKPIVLRVDINPARAPDEPPIFETATPTPTRTSTETPTRTETATPRPTRTPRPSRTPPTTRTPVLSATATLASDLPPGDPDETPTPSATESAAITVTPSATEPVLVTPTATATSTTTATQTTTATPGN